MPDRRSPSARGNTSKIPSFTGKNALSFANVIEENHRRLSVPVASNEAGTKDDAQQHEVTSASSAPHQRFRNTTLNPEQAAEENMPAAVAAYNVGGMAAFWTATIVRQQPKLERSPLICDKEWEELYSEADAVLKTSSQLFDFSIRHSVVTDGLRRTYSDQTESVSIDKLSYAGQRDPHCSSDIRWTSIDAILGEKLMEMLNDSKQSVFQLKCVIPPSVKRPWNSLVRDIFTYGELPSTTDFVEFLSQVLSSEHGPEVKLT